MIDRRFAFSFGTLKVRDIGRLNHEERQGWVPMLKFGNTRIIWWSTDALWLVQERRRLRLAQRQAANDNDLPSFLRGAVVHRRAANG